MLSREQLLKPILDLLGRMFSSSSSEADSGGSGAALNASLQEFSAQVSWKYMYSILAMRA